MLVFDAANELYHQGKYEEAVQAYERSIDSDSGFVRAWYNRGLALAKLGRYKEAIESQRIEKLWMAYVMWKPDLSFAEFLNSNTPQNQDSKIENGYYIDQIGFL